MAMKLSLRPLRDEIPAPAADQPAAVDWRRWMSRQLIVRRDDDDASSLSPPRAADAARASAEPAVELPWSDTQPGWHE